MSAVFTFESTIEAFDTAAQQDFITRLAGILDGVAPEDITLTDIRAASITATAVIRVSDAPAAQAVVGTISGMTLPSLSTALAVTLTDVSLVDFSPPPSPPPASSVASPPPATTVSSDGGGGGGAVAAIVIVVCFVLLIALGGGYVYFKKAKGGKSVKTLTVAKNSDKEVTATVAEVSAVNTDAVELDDVQPEQVDLRDEHSNTRNREEHSNTLGISKLKDFHKTL